MNFYLTDSNGNRIQLPTNPEQITAQTDSKLITFDIISLGSIDIPRGIVPVRITWEGKLLKEAKSIVGQLSGWRRSNAKIRLLVTETPLNINCYIAAFEHTWGGGYGYCDYRIDLVEARELVITAEGGQRAIAQRTAAPTPKTHTVRSGDTLYAIAKRLLGSGSRWREIYNANITVIGKDPNVIRPGQVLRI